MKQDKIKRIAKIAKKKMKAKKPIRSKTSIYIDQALFKQFKSKVGRESSMLIEEFIRAYLKP